MDREAKIIIPVSRWKLAEIGLACFWRRLRGKPQPLVRLGLSPWFFLSYPSRHSLNHPRKLQTGRVPKPNGSIF